MFIFVISLYEKKSDSKLVLGDLLKKSIKNPRSPALPTYHPCCVVFDSLESRVAAVAPVFLSQRHVRRKESDCKKGKSMRLGRLCLLGEGIHLSVSPLPPTLA